MIDIPRQIAGVLATRHASVIEVFKHCLTVVAHSPSNQPVMSQRLLSTASTHSDSSLLSFVDKACSYAVDTALAAGSGPVARIAELAVTGVLQRMQHGHLRIDTPQHTYTFPEIQTKGSVNQHPLMTARLNVVRETFWTRMLTMGDLGFAEAYMVRLFLYLRGISN